MNQDRETLVEALQNALESNPLVSVVFHTKTGRERHMQCSQQLLYVPKDQHDGRFNFRLNGPAILCVYDYQNGDWRAFRKDSVISFEILEWNRD
jgi:hypothetical protein